MCIFDKTKKSENFANGELIQKEFFLTNTKFIMCYPEIKKKKKILIYYILLEFDFTVEKSASIHYFNTKYFSFVIKKNNYKCTFYSNDKDDLLSWILLI